MYLTQQKDYVVVTPYGYEEEVNSDELWSWFLYNQPDGYSWFDLLDKLKTEGEARFTSGAIVRYKLHRTIIKKDVNAGCSHKDKYKNHAGGIYFWYCPSCKTDLGNV